MIINLKYLQENLNLKDLIKELDKTIDFIDGDNILNSLLESYPSFIDKNGDEIIISEEITENLDNKLSLLSYSGQLLTTVSDNFKCISQTEINLSSWDIFITCTFSKINKTYYMEVCEDRRPNGGTSIMYKSEKKETVINKMSEIKKYALKNNSFPSNF